MMPRFRLPVSQEYAESCLAMAVAAEGESRGHSISPDGDFEQCVRQTAAWTVNASPRHSLLLAGEAGCGAGFAVALAGSVLTMPGLPAHPAAMDISLTDDGRITGLF